MSHLTKEFIDNLAQYGQGEDSNARDRSILAWLRIHIDNDIGWVIEIIVQWVDQVTAQVHLRCEADFFMDFVYHLDKQKCGHTSYGF